MLRPSTMRTHRKGKSKMNAAVLKWLTLSMFGLVVVSALLLAAAVKPAGSQRQQVLMQQDAHALLVVGYHRALPADHAASAAMFDRVELH